MANFIAELPQKPARPIESIGKEWWTLYVDGASRGSGFGVDLILQSPTGELLEEAIWINFSTFNNEAEYEVVLAWLDLVLTSATTKLEICNNFQLIVGQIQKEYEAKDEHMTHYLTMVENRLKKLDEWTVRRVSWTENLKANVLARIVVTLLIREVVMLPIYLQAISSITLKPVCSATKVNSD